MPTLKESHWRAPRIGSKELTPERVRDELVNCFVAVQSCLPMPPGAPAMGPSEMRAGVRKFVADAFGKVGASFERPTKVAILAAMTECRKGALQMTDDAKLIQEHWDEMMSLVGRLPA